MAKESKTVKIHPDAESATVEQWQCFGWELLTRNEIYNKDSHLEKDGNNINSVTTTTHFVSLTFQRDTTINNYSQLIALENEFNAVPGVSAPPKLFGKLWLIILGVFAVIILSGTTQLEFGNASYVVGPLVLAVLIIVWRILRYKKLRPQWEAEASATAQKEQEILQRAKNLLS